MILQLNTRQLALLNELSLRFFDKNIINEGQEIQLTGDKDYFESLLDKLSNILIKEGIDSQTDEINEFGLEIESLIDNITRSIYPSTVK